MNILIVDGNEKEASSRYTNMGMDTQYEVYKKVLNSLSLENLNIQIIHPAISNNFLPEGISLDDFDGVAWTGSLLNIYDMTTPIINQIELAKELFTKKNKIFGSCWGLQVLVTAAGGKIRKNPKGLEAVVANEITVSREGFNHSMYKGKEGVFDAFCWHYDDTENLPPNAKILASNNKSAVQSVAFDIDQSSVWAVQYHPEFDPSWIAGLMKQREDILLKEGAFTEKKYFDEELNFFLNYKNMDDKTNKDKYKDLINISQHTLELFNWISNLKN
jgi:GMP synthase-like glutamine amidotransferase